VSEGLPDTVRARWLWFAIAIGVLCWWLGGRLPFDADARPAAAAAVLGVTALTITCWLTMALPIGAASLLPVALLPLFGAVPMETIVRGYGHPILWLFGGGFVLAQAIERWGLHRRLALRVVGIVGPHPRRIVLGVFLCATGISLWISNTSVALMLLPIGWAIVDRTIAGGQLSPAAARNFGAAVMLAIAYGASIGGMGTPIGTAPNALFFINYQSLVQQGAPPVTFLQWMIAFVPYVLVLTVVFSVLLTAVVLPLPRGRLAGGDAMLHEAKTLGPMTVPERRVACLFAAAVVLWVTRADARLAEDFVLRGWAHWLLGARSEFVPDGVVAVVVAIAAFVIPAGGGAGAGKRIMDWETARKLPFDILFLLGGSMALADAFEPTGLSRSFGALLAPLVGHVHPLLLITVLTTAILLLSEVASNTAIAALFLPILKQGAIAAHLDPRLLLLPATLAASCGFMLPIATPPNTIVFASGHISIGQMLRAGLVLDVLAIGLLVLVFWFWALPCLGVDPDVAPPWLR